MSNDTFQWTDERVLAFVNFTYRNNANLLLEKDLEAFKQSKMPKKSAMYYHTPPYPEQPKKERIEVKDVGIESILIKFEGRRLSVGEIEQVKAAIEKIINYD